MPVANTPWGIPDSTNVIAEGITFYSTPSHGGFHLSPERIAQMPEQFRAIPTFNDLPGWYEEDCDWCIVVLAFPDFFSEAQCQDAQLAFDAWIAPKLNKTDARKPHVFEGRTGGGPGNQFFCALCGHHQSNALHAA